MPEQDPDRVRLLLDPWSSDFSASIQADAEDEAPTAADIDPTVETGSWSALPPGTPPASAWFVDGVRRLDARLVGWRAGDLVHGLFATFAVGAVVISDGRASFAHCGAERKLILTSGGTHSTRLRVGNAELLFKNLSHSGANPADLVLALQTAMRNAEANLAETCSSDIVFLDGPLAYVNEPRGPIVGVIKTIHRLYLDADHMALVFRLQMGQRTPIFAIREGAKDRYSWYLRIGERRPIHHGLSGIIRLEAKGAAGLNNALALANVSAAYLPRFASTPARDPRAPQNLTPVGALEEHLRNQMGNATLIQRAIERRISEGLFI
jgi:hypothetical protein